MLIGEIPGGVVSLHGLSRLTPSAALGMREDGWVSLIDTVRENQKVRWAWSGLDNCPAACAGWLTSTVPVLYLRDGNVVTLDMSRVRRSGLTVIGEESSTNSGRAPMTECMGMVTREQCLVSGLPFVITTSEEGACWWSASTDMQPVFDAHYPWPANCPRAVRGPGSVLPWFNNRGFLKLVQIGSDVQVFLASREPNGLTLRVDLLGSVPIGSSTEYRLISGLSTGGEPGVSFALAHGNNVRAVRCQSGRPLEIMSVLRAEPEHTITSADFKQGLGLATISNARGGGGADLFSQRTGARLWQFETEVAVTDVLFTSSGDRLRALYVDTDGAVHLMLVAQEERRNRGSTPPPTTSPAGPSSPPTGRGIALD